MTIPNSHNPLGLNYQATGRQANRPTTIYSLFQLSRQYLNILTVAVLEQ